MTDDHPPDDNPAPLLERALRSSIRQAIRRPAPILERQNAGHLRSACEHNFQLPGSIDCGQR